MKSDMRDQIHRELWTIADFMEATAKEIRVVAGFGILRRVPDRTLIEIVFELLSELEPNAIPGDFGGRLTSSLVRLLQILEEVVEKGVKKGH